jgi:hypothetical protein
MKYKSSRAIIVYILYLEKTRVLNKIEKKYLGLKIERKRKILEKILNKMERNVK